MFSSQSFGLRYVNDVVLKDKQVRLALAGQAQHVFVVVLDPALDNFSVFQLYGDCGLLFSQHFEVLSFCGGVLRGNGFCLAASRRCHACILHWGAVICLTSE
jgi:hypothetical protein